MTYDADLNLIVCEHVTRSLVREQPDGRREILASHFEGQELNSPNDVCVRSDGSIYFSDPYYGRMPGFGVERRASSAFRASTASPRRRQALCRCSVERLLFDQPNGLCFSPDVKRLYRNVTARPLIHVFDVATDGSVSGGRIFFSGVRSSLERGVPDGMSCDHRGNIWVTAPGASWSSAPRGATSLGWCGCPNSSATSPGGQDCEFRALFSDRHPLALSDPDQGRPAPWALSACEVGDPRARCSLKSKRRGASRRHPGLALPKPDARSRRVACSSFRTCRTT